MTEIELTKDETNLLHNRGWVLKNDEFIVLYDFSEKNYMVFHMKQNDVADYIINLNIE